MQIKTKRNAENTKITVSIGATEPQEWAIDNSMYNPDIECMDLALAVTGLTRSGNPKRTRTSPSGLTKTWEVHAYARQ